MDRPIVLAATDNPDQEQMRQLGQQLRQRLANNPKAYKLPGDKADIWSIGPFLDAEECRRLIALIDAAAQPSAAYDTDYSSGFRTSHSANFERDDPFVSLIERRMDELLGIDPSFGETVQGQRYEPGQQFKPHTDWFHTNTGYWQKEKERGGQRSVTAMAYLNQVEEGGSTDFPALGVGFQPTAGALLVWNNADPQGIPNPAVLHAGRPVVRGVKYVITKWYRARPWQPGTASNR